MNSDSGVCGKQVLKDYTDANTKCKTLDKDELDRACQASAVTFTTKYSKAVCAVRTQSALACNTIEFPPKIVVQDVQHFVDERKRSFGPTIS